ncbi:MAG: alpha/beta hydrolase [Acidimicrobiia bacterium]|nr:MAG: alpha/beta hydrolase [Acidimicrobiia bacterium]
MASEPVPLAHLHWGGGGRRVLLLHGLGASAEGWWRLASALADAGFEVVAPDLRGHGDSPRGDSMALVDVAADVEALGDGWEAVVGHSMGGAVATLLAVSNPGWTRSLILQDPALLMPESMDQVLEWLLAEFAGPITADRLASDNPRWLPEDAAAKARALVSAGPATIEDAVRANWPWRLIDEAAAIPVPTLLLGSDPATGGLLPVALGEWLAATNPRIRYQIIPGSSHSAHRDSDAWEAYVSRVIGGIERPPTLGGNADQPT